MAPGRNILLFHQGALGDFIVTWPLAVALARLHPQSRVFYVTHGQKGALAERALRVESLDCELGAWHQLFCDEPKLPAPSAKALAGAHTVLNFLGAPDDQWSANVKAANPNASVLTISTTPPEDFAGHQSEFLASQLAGWPAVEEAAKQILHSIAERGLGTAPNASGPIVIHPGGGAAKKCWPTDCYIQLAERLQKNGAEVRVLLGEVELEKWPAAQVERIRNAAETATPATLVDLFRHISAASMFVGNDSGPGHLAGILGIPTLSLFDASSRPERWKPLGPRGHLLQAPLEALGVETVVWELENVARR